MADGMIINRLDTFDYNYPTSGDSIYLNSHVAEPFRWSNIKCQNVVGLFTSIRANIRQSLSLWGESQSGLYDVNDSMFWCKTDCMPGTVRQRSQGDFSTVIDREMTNFADNGWFFGLEESDHRGMWLPTRVNVWVRSKGK